MAKKKSLFQEFTKGIIKENPVLRLVLGTCATLAVSTAASNAIGMGLATTFVLVCSNAVISLLRNVIPDKVRIPSYITIIAAFVTIVQMFIKAFSPELDSALGIYLPLIVVNCIILGRAEMFANKHRVLPSIVDGLGMGVGFTATLLAMGIIVLLGALAYFVLTLVVNRRTPASPDTRYTAENGISVYYESAVWPVCEMTEDATLGRALELASAQSSDDANYQVVLFQRGTKDTYEDFIGQSEKELKQAYGVISPRKVDLNIDGAAVTAVRCDIQAYYAVLATIEYGSGDVIYVSGLTKLASISDIVNLVESVSLS